MEFKRILAPTDLSPFGAVGVQAAAELAHGLGAPLTLLHVATEDELAARASAHVPRRPLDLVLQDLEAALTDQFGRAVPMETRRSLRAQPLVAVGKPVTEILREAQLRGVDAIVMATHGRTGIAHFLTSGIAERVVQAAPCLVFTVRRSAKQVGWAGPSAAGKGARRTGGQRTDPEEGSVRLQKILVPLDGSALAEAILPRVVDVARTLGAELVLLRVALAHGIPGADPTERQVAAVRKAEKYLEAVSQRLNGHGLRVSQAVRYGRAAGEILDHAAFAGIDLIAMSTHGRTGLARMVMGSVTQQVVRNAPCPVLTVRPAETPTAAAAA